MKIGLLGKKCGMTRIFLESGRAVPVTVVEVEPSVVTGVKTKEKDGYAALQLGYGSVKEKKVNKSQKGFFSKRKIALKKRVYEIRLENNIEGVEQGDIVGVDNFEAGDYIDVTAISKGKGFQGAMKRYHFHGGRGSHGDSTGRRTGSIGQSAYPARVFKGMKMPGRMGGKQITIQNLHVVKIDLENNLLLVEGAIPGPTNNLVQVRISLKKGNEKDIKVQKTASEDIKEEVKEEVKEETADVAEVLVDAESAAPEEAKANDEQADTAETATDKKE